MSEELEQAVVERAEALAGALIEAWQDALLAGALPTCVVLRDEDMALIRQLAEIPDDQPGTLWNTPGGNKLPMVRLEAGQVYKTEWAELVCRAEEREEIAGKLGAYFELRSLAPGQSYVVRARGRGVGQGG